MYGHIEHPRVIIEGLLRALAVVEVEVHYHNPPGDDKVFLVCVAGAHPTPSPSAVLAATTTLLNPQKPQRVSAMAWWPGGRTRPRPLWSLPANTCRSRMEEQE